MNRPMVKGLTLAAVHVLIVASLGVTLLVDRAMRPRVWARAAPIDPNLPIRGRYVSLRLEAATDPALRPSRPPDERGPKATPVGSERVMLFERDQQLVAVPIAVGGLLAHLLERDGRAVTVLDRPIAYFIPEHVADPSRRAAGEELWVEVTIPRKGLPRPIRLGVKKGGVLTPLEFN